MGRCGAAGMACTRLLRNIGGNIRGAVALEYGLLAGLIVVALILAVKTFASANLSVWTNVTSKVVNAG